MPINKSNLTSYLLTDDGMKETLYDGEDRYYSADEVDSFIQNLKYEVELEKETVRDSVNNRNIDVIEVDKISYIWGSTNMLGGRSNTPSNGNIRDIDDLIMGKKWSDE